jgi:hypothetical protein
MKKSGRPIGSEIRQNIIEILNVIGKGYGYQISKLYQQIFPSCTKECIYYHLKKGVELNEISINEVKHETGDFSWGSQVTKTYYSIGFEANPTGNPLVKYELEKLNIAKK